jgi:hypothetical protein
MKEIPRDKGMIKGSIDMMQSVAKERSLFECIKRSLDDLDFFIDIVFK